MGSEMCIRDSSEATHSTQTAAEETADDDWCATHVDHGCLTGLTSAMYIDEAQHPPHLPQRQYSSPPPSTPTTIPTSTLPPLPELASSPDPQAGLYIHSRSGQITQIRIPRDCLAFQTGEALEVITRGKFRAVPHFVRGVDSAGHSGQRVARNTLAVFTQANLWEVVDEEKGLEFAAFARGIVERNH